MSEYIEFSRLERLLIWMRRNKFNFSEMGKALGITRVSARRLCNAERISQARHRELVRLGVPIDLLPPAEDVRRGPKAGSRHR